MVAAGVEDDDAAGLGVVDDELALAEFVLLGGIDRQLDRLGREDAAVGLEPR